MGNKALEETVTASIDFAKQGGFVPVVMQDVHTNEVVLVAYANQAALEKTQQTGYATFYSRQRQVLVTKGELEISEIRVDCDQDALLYLVNNKGTHSCHTNPSRPSCFYRRLNADNTLSYL